MRETDPPFDFGITWEKHRLFDSGSSWEKLILPSIPVQHEIVSFNMRERTSLRFRLTMRETDSPWGLQIFLILAPWRETDSPWGLPTFFLILAHHERNWSPLRFRLNMRETDCLFDSGSPWEHGRYILILAHHEKNSSPLRFRLTMRETERKPKQKRKIYHTVLSSLRFRYTMRRNWAEA